MLSGIGSFSKEKFERVSNYFSGRVVGVFVDLLDTIRPNRTGNN